LDLGLPFPFPPKIDRVLVTVQEHPEGCQVDVIVHGGNPPEGFPVRENHIHLDLGRGANTTFNEAHFEIQNANGCDLGKELSEGFFQDVGKGVHGANTQVGLVHFLIAGSKGDGRFGSNPIIYEPVGADDIER